MDKTTREILFLPLPVDMKYQAKPFIDVTVDRGRQGHGRAACSSSSIKDWGLDLEWRQLSYASVTMMVDLGRLRVDRPARVPAAFRRSIEQQDVGPPTMRLDAADSSSIETLLTELAHPEPRRVLYAIDMLEALDKRQLVTPLLLAARIAGGAHPRAAASPLHRTRRSRIAGCPAWSGRWPIADGEVRARRRPRAGGTARRGGRRRDASVSRPRTIPNLVVDGRGGAGRQRRRVGRRRPPKRHSSAWPATPRESAARAAAAGGPGARTASPTRAFRPLLVPLMYDDNYYVARAAVNSAGTIGGDDFLYVPTLVSADAEPAVEGAGTQGTGRLWRGRGADRSPTSSATSEEDMWVRRHVPSTLARIPSDASVQALIAALDGNDGFLRFKAITALERIRPTIRRWRSTARQCREAHPRRGRPRVQRVDAVHKPVRHRRGQTDGAAGPRSGGEAARAIDRVFQPARPRSTRPGDVVAVSAALGPPKARHRSSALELLDNMLTGEVRRRVMLLVEDMPADERVRKGNVIYKTRARDLEDTVAQLVHDENQIVAAAAILLIEERRSVVVSDDLEHVLAHRDARDWQVFEAASWALAASRMPAERRRQTLAGAAADRRARGHPAAAAAVRLHLRGRVVPNRRPGRAGAA